MNLNDLNLENLTNEKYLEIMSKQLNKLYDIHKHVVDNTDINSSFLFMLSVSKSDSDNQAYISEGMSSSSDELLIESSYNSRVFHQLANLSTDEQSGSIELDDDMINDIIDELQNMKNDNE